jgi:hypothetical protein
VRGRHNPLKGAFVIDIQYFGMSENT